jgi:NAD(P)-dependent dehydrogenase (short-subunit alcohol dehydrogenase family)
MERVSSEKAMTGAVRDGPLSGVIVTGGGSGIGRATAFALAETARPVATWDVDAGAAEAVASECRSRFHVPAVGVGIDVRATAEFEAAVTRSRATIGTIGGLVHAAGIVGGGPIDRLDEWMWNDVIAVHLSAAALLIRAVAPDLEAEPGSAVVLVASIEALIANGSVPAYCAAKTGMLGLARSSAARLGPRGVRVNSVCPGFIDTPMLRPALEREPNARATYEGRVPLRRIGRSEDVAAAVRFLLSDDAAYITAAELVVDGGVTRTVF